MKPNDKVICINDVFEVQGDSNLLPEKGQTYTVRSTFTFQRTLRVRLEGIQFHNKHPQFSEEWGFNASRFRHTTETSIA